MFNNVNFHTTLNTAVINSAYHKTEVNLTEIFVKKHRYFIVKIRRRIKRISILIRENLCANCVEISGEAVSSPVTVWRYKMNESSTVWCIVLLRCELRGINIALGTGTILAQVCKLDIQFQREILCWPSVPICTLTFHAPQALFGKITEVNFHFSFSMGNRADVGSRRKVCKHLEVGLML